MTLPSGSTKAPHSNMAIARSVARAGVAPRRPHPRATEAQRMLCVRRGLRTLGRGAAARGRRGRPAPRRLTRGDVPGASYAAHPPDGQETTMTRTTLLALLAIALGVAVPVSFAQPPPRQQRSGPSGHITVRATETLSGSDVTDGGVAGRGRFRISGAITDKGKVTDHRTVKGSTATL